MCITDKQLDFLKEVQRGELHREDNPKRFSETKIRIRNTIDKSFANMLWLASNMPEILKDEVCEINDPSLERYRRFKALAYVVSLLDPMTELGNIDLPNMLRKLGQLYPKYYFEIIRKKR